MARKVGFEKPDTDPKKSVADSYLDEFRAKSKTQQQTAPRPKRRVRRNWFVIIFLTIWIICWSFGILLAIGMLIADGPVAFILIWLAAACFGWVIALGALIAQIKGIPIDDDGETQ